MTSSARRRRHSSAARIFAIVTAACAAVMLAASGPALAQQRQKHDPAAAARRTCPATLKFTGSVSAMEHFMDCEGVPYTVVTPDPTRYAGQGRSIVRAPGGPSCEWLARNVAKVCYHSGGKPSFLCVKWFAGSYYSDHCGPVDAYSLAHAEDATVHIPGVLKACIRDAFEGGIIGFIVKAVEHGGPIGVLVGLAGGCIGGALNYEIDDN